MHGSGKKASCLSLLLAACLLGAVSSGCGGSKAAEKPPDQRYGHRYAERGPEGRVTFHLTPPDSSRRYFSYPVPVSEVIVRAPSFTNDTSAVPVELLVKGALPTACFSLDEATQERFGNIVEVEFTMRQALGAVCENLKRPYRFYLPLEGTYRPGDYTLKLNGSRRPFSLGR